MKRELLRFVWDNLQIIKTFWPKSPGKLTIVAQTGGSSNSSEPLWIHPCTLLDKLLPKYNAEQNSRVSLGLFYSRSCSQWQNIYFCPNQRRKISNCINPLLHIYTFIALTNSVDPDQPAHSCCLPRICTVHFLIGLVISGQHLTSADPD
jgi:hypothetical protein